MVFVSIIRFNWRLFSGVFTFECKLCSSNWGEVGHLSRFKTHFLKINDLFVWLIPLFVLGCTGLCFRFHHFEFRAFCIESFSLDAKLEAYV